MGLKKPYFNLLVDWLPQVEWPLRENTIYFYVFKKKRWLDGCVGPSLNPKMFYDFSTNLEPFATPQCFYCFSLHAYIML
jgi:hypothetical protein